MYAYTQYYMGGIGNNNEQLRSWNNCCSVKHLSWLPKRHRVKYLELYAALTSPEGFSNSKLLVSQKGLQDLECLL